MNQLGGDRQESGRGKGEFVQVLSDVPIGCDTWLDNVARCVKDMGQTRSGTTDIIHSLAAKRPGGKQVERYSKKYISWTVYWVDFVISKVAWHGCYCSLSIISIQSAHTSLISGWHQYGIFSHITAT